MMRIGVVIKPNLTGAAETLADLDRWTWRATARSGLEH